MDKRAELLKLAKLRQATRWEGYKCIGDYHDGIYECDFVSPYTKTAGNVDAEILVMLQDWSSDESLKGSIDYGAATLGHTPHLPTTPTIRITARRARQLALPVLVSVTSSRRHRAGQQTLEQRY